MNRRGGSFESVGIERPAARLLDGPDKATGGKVVPKLRQVAEAKPFAADRLDQANEPADRIELKRDQANRFAGNNGFRKHRNAIAGNVDFVGGAEKCVVAREIAIHDRERPELGARRSGKVARGARARYCDDQAAIAAGGAKQRLCSNPNYRRTILL